jgi:hypothetical protein
LTTVTKNIAWNDRVTDMAEVVVSPKYFSSRDRHTENDHRIFKLFVVLADSNQDLPLPSYSAGNGKVILRSARTAAGILKFTGTTHVTVVTTCCSLQPDSHRGYNLLQSAARQSPWLQLAAVCSQPVTVVKTCCSLQPDSHRGYNLLQSAARQSPWLQIAAVCSQTVTVVTTCCGLQPVSHCGYNLLQSAARQSPWLQLAAACSQSLWLQLAAVCSQTVIVVTTCCSLYPDSHRGYNLLQSAARQSSWLQLASVCSQTVTVVITCCCLQPDSHRGYNLLQSVSRQSTWLQLSHLP